MGNSSGAAGTYNLNGGTLSVGSLVQGAGNGKFNFGGSGLLQASGPFTSTLPINMATQSNSMLDTNGFAVTLSGNFSGQGDLAKVGAGTLTLSGSNGAFGGSLFVSAGTVVVAKGAAMPNCLLTVSGTNPFTLVGPVGTLFGNAAAGNPGLLASTDLGPGVAASGDATTAFEPTTSPIAIASLGGGVGIANVSGSPTPVPEPGALALLMAGLLGGLATWLRRRG